jgi:tetratricopeptide (TPR) repeat protein
MLEELARDEVMQGYLGHAEESFALLATRFPDEPSVWQNIALVQRQTDRFEEAALNLKKAQALRPEPQNVILQAYCLMNLGRLQEGYDLLRDFLAQPDNAELDGFRGQARSLSSSCLLMLNRPSDLLQTMESWSGFKENAFLSAQYAQALLQSGDMRSARAALKEGIQKHRQQLLFRLAAAIPRNVFEGGRQSLARESQKALRLIDLKTMAYLWAEFGQWEKCMEAFKEIDAISPIQDVELLLLQSNALESLGQREESLSVLRKCQALAPDNSVVQNNLGYHLLESGGDVQEAASLIKAALDQEPDNASYLDSWGWALFKQGEFEEAEVALQKAAEVDPFTPEIRKHLGDALLKLGRPLDALEQWERAMAFVFPDRKMLEEQISRLRTELANKALEESEDDQDSLPGDDDDDDLDGDDGW